MLSVMPVLLLIGSIPAAEPSLPPAKVSPPVGVWEGTLKVGPVELRLAFTIRSASADTFTATLDSIDQGAKDIPVEKITFSEEKVTLELPKLKASYSGKFAADHRSIQGEWKQAGVSFPLELKRVEKAGQIKRPQTPRKPFPYEAEDVVVENPSAHLQLAGTLTKPKGAGPFRAVILITGSGPQDRDETILGHKPFLVIADHLTRKGIAVLRVDDRGCGKSAGEFGKATSADFATDVRAAVAFLKERKDVDPKRIGLLGHSEGGMIAPMVAAENGDIASIVLLAAPGLPGEELLIMQAQALLKAMKADEKTLAWQRKTQEQLFQLVRRGADAKTIRAALDEASKEIPGGIKKEAASRFAAQFDLSKQLLSSPWLRYFLDYDPRTDLKKVRCPVLALNGEKDVQVPPKENLPEIEKVLKAAGNRNVAIHELKGLNHLFQTCESGLPSEYGKIEETFSSKALEIIGEWILKQP